MNITRNKKVDNAVWNRGEARFKNSFMEPKDLTPAPGEYNDLNRWNKRTFNLKYLYSPNLGIKNESDTS